MGKGLGALEGLRAVNMACMLLKRIGCQSDIRAVWRAVALACSEGFLKPGTLGPHCMWHFFSQTSYDGRGPSTKDSCYDRDRGVALFR